MIDQQRTQKESNKQRNISICIFLKRKLEICKVCGCTFEIAIGKNKITCSKECRKEYQNKLCPSKLKKIKPIIIKNCKNCDKEFAVGGNYRINTCSKECKKIKIKQLNLKYCQKRDGIIFKTLICIICNNEFKTTRKEGQILVCSKKCQKIKIRNDNRKYTGVIFTTKKCRICDKEFKTTRKGKVKTCSKECIKVFKKKYRINHIIPIFLNCVECGKEFRKINGSLTCSKECSKKHRNYIRNKWCKDFPEKVLKLQLKSLDKQGIEFKLPGRKFAWALESWGNTVRKILGNYCSICESKDGLNSHHIFYRSKYPRLALNTNNGIPLCKIHHKEIHDLNGWR